MSAKYAQSEALDVLAELGERLDPNESSRERIAAAEQLVDEFLSLNGRGFVSVKSMQQQPRTVEVAIANQGVIVQVNPSESIALRRCGPDVHWVSVPGLRYNRATGKFEGAPLPLAADAPGQPTRRDGLVAVALAIVELIQSPPKRQRTPEEQRAHEASEREFHERSKRRM